MNIFLETGSWVKGTAYDTYPPDDATEGQFGYQWGGYWLAFSRLTEPGDTISADRVEANNTGSSDVPWLLVVASSTKPGEGQLLDVEVVWSGQGYEQAIPRTDLPAGKYIYIQATSGGPETYYMGSYYSLGPIEFSTAVEAFATVRITVVAPEQGCNYNCTCLDTDGSARNVETLGVLRDRMVRRLGFVDPLQDGAPRTLADLRRDLLIRLGHAASVDRPPPGMSDLLDQIIAESEQQLWSRLELDRGDAAVPPRMSDDSDTTTLSATLVFAQALGVAKAHAGKQDAELYLQQAERMLADYVRQSPAGIRATIDDFLREAQRFLYEKVASFRQSRFFEWELQEGVRFYDFHENADECHRKLVPELVEGVYVTHVPCPHERWQKLHGGIDPLLYNGGIRNSWPQRYEFRQCIEIFPAPDDRGGFLRIKAKSDLEPFEDDMHVTTIDADLVFLLALANAKAHFNQPDAQKYDQLAQSRIGDIIAGSHHTNRYIPGDVALPNATPPRPKDGWDW